MSAITEPPQRVQRLIHKTSFNDMNEAYLLPDPLYPISVQKKSLCHFFHSHSTTSPPNETDTCLTSDRQAIRNYGPSQRTFAWDGPQ